jgi:hypothetical protein
VKAALWAAALIVVLGLVGCRQRDGEVPSPADDEQVNKIGDIGGDLRNVAAGRPGAVGELRDDLSNLGIDEPPMELVDKMVAALQSALVGTAPSEEAREQIAGILFVVTTARQLSPGQIEQVQSDLRAALVQAGAEEHRASDVSAVAGELQATVTQNRRRWYQRF